MRVDVKQVVSYGGHNTNKNGSVTLTLEAAYSELTGTMKLNQMLNENVKVTATVPDAKPAVLGVFMIDNINIHNDGTSRIKLKGLAESVESGNILDLPRASDDNPMFNVQYEADIEDDLEDTAADDGDADEWDSVMEDE